MTRLRCTLPTFNYTENSFMWMIHRLRIRRHIHIFRLHIFRKDGIKYPQHWRSNQQYASFRSMHTSTDRPSLAAQTSAIALLLLPDHHILETSTRFTPSCPYRSLPLHQPSAYIQTRSYPNPHTALTKFLRSPVMPFIMMHVPNIPIHNAILLDPAPLVRIIFHTTMRNPQRDCRPST